MYLGSFHFTFTKCVNEIYGMAHINSYNMKQGPDGYYQAQKPLELFPKLMNQIVISI